MFTRTQSFFIFYFDDQPIIANVEEDITHTMWKLLELKKFKKNRVSGRII